MSWKTLSGERTIFRSNRRARAAPALLYLRNGGGFSTSSHTRHLECYGRARHCMHNGSRARTTRPRRQRINPVMPRSAPYRADEVGSLLRPAELKDARAARAAGKIGAEELREVEDREIRDGRREARGGRAEGGHRRRVPSRPGGISTFSANWRALMSSRPSTASSSRACRPKRRR